MFTSAPPCRHRRPLASVSVAWAVILLVMLGAGRPDRCPAELFRVRRNTNANVVVYEASLGADGLDPAAPVRATWILLAEDGRREDLNAFERTLAYGVEVHGEPTPGGAVVALRARPDVEIAISIVDGCPVALARVAGRTVVLRFLSVEATGGIIPQVRWVDLVGVDVATGQELRERLLPPEERQALEP